MTKPFTHDPEIIDFSNEVLAIKKQFAPNFWRKPEAMNALADLWGASTNAHDVLDYEAETIVQVGQCEGEIKFAHTSKNYWLIGISARSAFNGLGYSPSIMATQGYATRTRARKDGILKLVEFFNDVVQDNSSCNSESNKTNAKKTLSILQSELTPQLGLFD